MMLSAFSTALVVSLIALASPAVGSSQVNAAPSSFLADDTLERVEDQPLEQIPGVVTLYTSVETRDGTRLRALISRPENTTSRLKPLIFTQWVSCGSVEYRSGSGAREILASLAQNSGLALVRIERAGTGDSTGPACNELDYNTEIRHYIEGFSQLLTHAWIDASEVFVYGASLGSTTAPIVSQGLQSEGYDIAGIAVQGGGALTHFERMLNFDRLYLERRSEQVMPQAIHDQMNSRALFHTEYLINARHPRDIANDSEKMASIRADIRGLAENDHYGRPFAWHQQAAQHNFLGAWVEIEAPVLVIFNALDQFEVKAGHALIVNTVNRLRPGTAMLIEQPNLGHSHLRFGSLEAAYANEGGEPAWDETASHLVNWFKQQLE